MLPPIYTAAHRPLVSVCERPISLQQALSKSVISPLRLLFLRPRHFLWTLPQGPSTVAERSSSSGFHSSVGKTRWTSSSVPRLTTRYVLPFFRGVKPGYAAWILNSDGHGLACVFRLQNFTFRMPWKCEKYRKKDGMFMRSLYDFEDHERNVTRKK